LHHRRHPPESSTPGGVDRVDRLAQKTRELNEPLRFYYRGTAIPEVLLEKKARYINVIGNG
jgi:hypothetical protein